MGWDPSDNHLKRFPSEDESRRQHQPKRDRHLALLLIVALFVAMGVIAVIR